MCSQSPQFLAKSVTFNTPPGEQGRSTRVLLLPCTYRPSSGLPPPWSEAQLGASGLDYLSVRRSRDCWAGGIRNEGNVLSVWNSQILSLLVASPDLIAFS